MRCEQSRVVPTSGTLAVAAWAESVDDHAGSGSHFAGEQPHSLLEEVEVVLHLHLLEEESDAEDEREQRQDEGDEQHVLNAGGGGMSVAKHQHVLLEGVERRALRTARLVRLQRPQFWRQLFVQFNSVHHFRS